MATQTQQRTKAKEPPPQLDFENMIDTNGRNLRAVMRANEVMLESMTAFGREVMEFGNTRLRHDLETSGSFMRCGDGMEAFGLQCDYLRLATQQYVEETNKLVSLGGRMAQDCWAPLEDRTRAALTEMNQR